MKTKLLLLSMFFTFFSCNKSEQKIEVCCRNDRFSIFQINLINKVKSLIYQVCQTRLERLLLDERYRATASFSVVCSLPRFPRVLIGLALTNRSIDCNPIRGSQLEAEIRTPNRFEILISTPDRFLRSLEMEGKSGLKRLRRRSFPFFPSWSLEAQLEREE